MRAYTLEHAPLSLDELHQSSGLSAAWNSLSTRTPGEHQTWTSTHSLFQAVVHLKLLRRTSADSFSDASRLSFDCTVFLVVTVTAYGP